MLFSCHRTFGRALASRPTVSRALLRPVARVLSTRVGPSPEELTDSQRAVLGCPEYTDKMSDSWQSSDIDINDDFLKIQGHPVMERWETPYMARLAEIAAQGGGKVLELGFGMAISATFIQSHPIKEHVIIEANDQVAERARAWSNDTAKSVVKINHGFSWDVSPQLADGSFDGILYDTYPIQAGKANLHHRDFFAEAHRLLRKGGVFTYCAPPAHPALRAHARAAAPPCAAPAACTRSLWRCSPAAGAHSLQRGRRRLRRGEGAARLARLRRHHRARRARTTTTPGRPTTSRRSSPRAPVAARLTRRRRRRSPGAHARRLPVLARQDHRRAHVHQALSCGCAQPRTARPGARRHAASATHDGSPRTPTPLSLRPGPYELASSSSDTTRNSRRTRSLDPEDPLLDAIESLLHPSPSASRNRALFAGSLLRLSSTSRVLCAKCI
jgi:spermidine synthase